MLYKTASNGLRAGRSGVRMPTTVTERSTARVCGRSLAGVAGSNSAGDVGVYVACCTVKIKCRR